MSNMRSSNRYRFAFRERIAGRQSVTDHFVDTRSGQVVTVEAASFLAPVVQPDGEPWHDLAGCRFLQSFGEGPCELCRSGS